MRRMGMLRHVFIKEKPQALSPTLFPWAFVFVFIFANAQFIEFLKDTSSFESYTMHTWGPQLLNQLAR